MPFSYRDWIFGGKTFCCCLPVRFGVISMTLLGMLVAGLLSLGLWYEVASTIDMTSGERAAFVLGGIAETILFLASILGFVGTIVRKQSFIQTYAYIVYGHFFLNIGVAAYLFYVFAEFQERATRVACDTTISNPDAQEECRGLFRVTTKVFIAVAAVVLFLELYGIIIVTRYLNLVKREKRMLREHKRANDSAFSLEPLNRGFYPGSTTAIYAPLNQQDEEFDPYIDAHSKDRTLVDGEQDDKHAKSPPIEVGYGGGSWTHREITDEEKSRLARADDGSVTVSVGDLTQAEREQRRAEFKSPNGPPAQLEAEPDSLPQYVAFPVPGHAPPGNPS